jgi:hypothetical protein
MLVWLQGRKSGPAWLGRAMLLAHVRQTRAKLQASHVLVAWASSEREAEG